MNTAATLTKRDQILALLASHIASRPGLEFGNYGDVSAYRSEMRSITKDRHEAERLMAAVAWRSGIGEQELRAAFKNAFSGRLSITDLPDGRMRLDYCTGQYYPTEYRKAACAVLASALWEYTRESCNARTDDRIYGSLGDEIRATLRKEFGRSIASRWFN